MYEKTKIIIIHLNCAIKNVNMRGVEFQKVYCLFSKLLGKSSKYFCPRENSSIFHINFNNFI